MLRAQRGRNMKLSIVVLKAMKCRGERSNAIHFICQYGESGSRTTAERRTRWPASAARKRWRFSLMLRFGLNGIQRTGPLSGGGNSDITQSGSSGYSPRILSRKVELRSSLQERKATLMVTRRIL